VGLADKAGVRPDLLSGGQRQRVAIARALANGPDVVFADEPTANLDSHTAEEILDLMRRESDQRGVAFLFATHDPRVVTRARRVIALHDGRIESDRAVPS
jgi:putative ABC transport system ATP-binding protein